LKLIGKRGGPLVDAAPGEDDWYANVPTIERRKCLLMVHADTLFAVLDTDVRVAQLNDLGSTSRRLSLTRWRWKDWLIPPSARRTRPVFVWRGRRARACSAT
jgi:hypothetical protein